MAVPKNSLERLQTSGTVIIADTADPNQIPDWLKPAEITTNPSLILAACRLPHMRSHLVRAAQPPSDDGHDRQSAKINRLTLAYERLSVFIGMALLAKTSAPCIFTQVPPVFAASTDPMDTVDSALRMIDLYAKENVPQDQVRIKIPATWTGLMACDILERECEVQTLATTVFGLDQVIMAEEVGVSAVAPYVGRIGDWFAANDKDSMASDVDRGVERVLEMQAYLRQQSPTNTKVMAASFRNTKQLHDLEGVDMVTVSPSLLAQLVEEVDKKSSSGASTSPKAGATSTKTAHKTVRGRLTNPGSNQEFETSGYMEDQNGFERAFDQDKCAKEKTNDAIRRFAIDAQLVEDMIAEL